MCRCQNEAADGLQRLERLSAIENLSACSEFHYVNIENKRQPVTAYRAVIARTPLEHGEKTTVCGHTYI